MIRDRIVLGALAGFVSTLSKSFIVGLFKRVGAAEFNGAETAAGMVLPAYKISTPSGKVVGHLANSLIGMLLGVTITYALSYTGKDHAYFKGAGISSIFWLFLYGNYAHVGGSTVRPALPATVLCNLAGHIGYGLVSAFMITRLGHPSLFKKGKFEASETHPQRSRDAVQDGELRRKRVEAPSPLPIH